MEFENQILNRINALCHERNWTTYKLAKESNIPYATLTHMLKRNTVPTLPTLEKLCCAFNISLSQFFYSGKDIIELSSEQLELLEYFDGCNSEKRELILNIAKSINALK